MAEYIRFRLTAAKVGASMALLALIAGLAGKTQSGPTQVNAKPAAFDAFLKLDGLTGESKVAFNKLQNVFIKMERALASVEHKLADVYYKPQLNAIFLKIRTANAEFLHKDAANAEFLKIQDAYAKFLKIDGTAANSTELGGKTSDAFVQGKGSIVSGAVSVNGDGKPATLLRSADGMITASVVASADGSVFVVVHNGTGVPLTAVHDPTAVELPAGVDTRILMPSDGKGAAQLILQIFPAGSYRHVLTLTVSADQPQTTAAAPIGVVAQMADGSV
jgi:hypothetical protein